MNEEATEVWTGNLSDNSVAVLLLNKGSLSNEVEIRWKEIGFNNTEFEIRDLWERKNLGKFKNGYKINFWKIKKIQKGKINYLQNLKNMKKTNLLQNLLKIFLIESEKFQK